MRVSRSSRPAARTLLAAAALAAVLTGCNRTSPMHTGSVKGAGGISARFERMTDTQLRGAVDSYGAAYAKNPKDRGAGLDYATLLQMTGRNDQSLAVMRQVAISHSKDREVLAAYGKALAAAGDLAKALETVRRAQTPDHPDWRLFSAEGAILDQLGKSAEARVLYRKALDLKPDEPSVLSNLGMSHLLANDPKTAETYLRQAVERPGADSRVRQNLALVVGLQGRFAEAERIATAELSPEDATANVAYLRKMLVQQNTWSMLRDDKPAANKAAGKPTDERG